MSKPCLATGPVAISRARPGGPVLQDEFTVHFAGWPATFVRPISPGAAQLRSGLLVPGWGKLRQYDILWMDEIRFAPPKKPWNDDSQCEIPTNNGFNHGFKVVRNGFRPSTVGWFPHLESLRVIGLLLLCQLY